MFGKRAVRELIAHSTDNQTDRRNFMRAAAVAGMGVVGATALEGKASAATPAETATEAATDAAVLNFALNLEYLEAAFYHNAVYGTNIPSALTTGKGNIGKVTGGGRAVDFQTPLIKAYATEITGDETNHVAFLRKALGSARVAQPAINIVDSFNGLAKAAGLGDSFDPYANEINFLIGAFIFEDVGVTAYKGAAPLVTNKTYLGAAAGILAVEAYHAGIIRTTLTAIDAEQPSLGIKGVISKIAAVRDAVDGKAHDDQGIGVGSGTNLVPTDANSIAFGRSAANVLNIVYATPKKASSGGFYPKGMNGAIKTSNDNT